MVTVDSVTFDLTDCSLKEQEADMKGWMDSQQVAYKIKRLPPPAKWKFDLTDATAAARFYEQQCADNKGVMLTMDVTSAGGAEALQGLFKYRFPLPGSLAMYFVGILYLPFQTCCFQINVEAMETGTTGIREATVLLLEQAERPAEASEPIRLKEGEDLHDRFRAAPLRKLPSDDVRWDESFPDHPLSKVRARLASVIDTLQLDPEVQALAPFRLSPARKGWWPWKR